MPCYLTREMPCILACRQPALTLALAHARELATAPLLAGTGLREAALQAPQQTISPAQLLTLLHNLARQSADAELPFILGAQWLPGHYGHISHALMLAPTLRQALQLLVRWSMALSPLLTPRLELDAEGATLYWHNAWGAAGQHAFLVDLHMSAVAGMTRWLSGNRLPWRFHFNRTRPRETAAHEVHLGPQLHFGAQRDAMQIDAAWLDQPWPRGNPAAVNLALPQAVQQEASQEVQGLLATLYDYLYANLNQGPTLDSSSQALGTSPATLKRHLSLHGTHFQAELDLVRSHLALDLLLKKGMGNEAVAAHLGFHDGNNFRRAFKRWTGLTPRQLT